MTKIKIEAILMPPPSQMYIPGPNSPIFKGTFEIDVPNIPALPDYLTEIKYVKIGGLRLHVTECKKARGGKIVWHCRSSLEHISSKHFAMLKEAGWVLDEKEAQKRGYPDDAMDAALKKRNDEDRQKVETHIEFIKRLTKWGTQRSLMRKALARKKK